VRWRVLIDLGFDPLRLPGREKGRVAARRDVEPPRRLHDIERLDAKPPRQLEEWYSISHAFIAAPPTDTLTCTRRT
jgi:hypothetical protein